MKAFLIGLDIANSQSPAIHRGWIAEHALKASYDLLETESFEEAFLSLSEDTVGVNITSPFKDDALEFCDSLDRTAKDVGSVNTMVRRKGRWVGHNTDAYGFYKGLPGDPRQFHNALVLGSGGAAKAVLHSLVRVGDIAVTLSGRNEDKARDIAFNNLVEFVEWDRFDYDLRPYDLIVNATGSKDLEVDLTQTSATIYDLTYGEESAMITAGKKARLKTIDGLTMLKYQAAKSFELWFGVDPL